MLSDADYKELKGQQGNLNTEGRTALREYELSNPAHLAESSGIQKLDETAPKPASVNVPALPPEAAVPKPVDKLQAMSDQVNAPAPGIDTSRDLYLPNASKLKTLSVPPEYVSKNPLAGLKHVAVATVLDPLEGPGVGVYHEPPEKQFQADMGPVLAARGVHPGSAEYADAFNEYKDRKWAQAYQQAQATDTPLTRIAYVDHSGAWAKLKDTLAELPDVASAFAKGFASGGTLHATDALETGADQQQAERDPIARGAGELAGSMNPGGMLARGAGALGKVTRLIPGGIVGRLAGGAAVGAAASDVDLAGREAARALREGSPGSAKEEFVRSLPGASLYGAGFGLGGSLLAEGANALQKSAIASSPEIGQLRRGGGDTDLLRGVKPGPDVAANVEAAREPIPGEDKAPPVGNATEIAAQKVQGPLAETNAAAHQSVHKQIGAEQDAAIAADPKLREALPAKATAQAAVDWALAKLQPEARPGYLPGISKPLSTDVLPGADIAEVQKLAPRLWKPRIVTAADASGIAERARGRSITLDEARRMGLDVGGMSKGLNAEGVPLDAPPLPSEPEPDTGGGSTTAEVFGRPADAIAPPRAGTTLKPREGRAFKTPTGPSGSDWFDEKKAAETVALNSGDYAVGDPFARTPGPPKGGLQTRILDAAEKIGKQRVRLADLREALPDVPRATLDQALKDSQQAGNLVLMRLDNPQEIGPKDAAGKLDIAGAERHILYLTPEGRAHLGAANKPGNFDTPTTPGTPEAPPEIPSIRPTGAPSALRASPAPAPPAALPSIPSGPTIGGIPESQYRVILEPRRFDAKTFEEILGDVDRKAKAGSATAQPDPAWKALQRAIREDRSQFGSNWTDLIAKHHELLNDAEQRSYHAGINEKKPYSEMQGSSQQTMNGKLVDFPGGSDSARALRELAAQAGPGVLHDLEVLGAQNAYSKLKGLANPKIGETVGAGGIAGHLRGFGPAVKLRADAVARGVSAGPTGEPTITPRIISFVRQNAPRAKFLPGLTSMGAGSLGLKAGSVYGSTRDRGDNQPNLSPSEQQFLDQLIQATQAHPEAP